MIALTSDRPLTGRVARIAVVDHHLMRILRVAPLLLLLGSCRMWPRAEVPRPTELPSDAGAPAEAGTPTATAPVTTPPTAPAVPVSCRPDRTEALATTAGRLRRCVIDVGSRN